MLFQDLGNQVYQNIDNYGLTVLMNHKNKIFVEVVYYLWLWWLEVFETSQIEFHLEFISVFTVQKHEAT